MNEGIATPIRSWAELSPEDKTEILSDPKYAAQKDRIEQEDWSFTKIPSGVYQGQWACFPPEKEASERQKEDRGEK